MIYAAPILQHAELMRASTIRVAFAALLGLTVLAAAEEPPQRPADAGVPQRAPAERPEDRTRPQLPEARPREPAEPPSPFPTPGVNPAEHLPPDQLSPATNDELFGSPDAMLVGTNVHLENLTVRAKSGVLLRAADDGHEIYVAPIDPSWLDFIAIGARIDVRGTLVESPTAHQAKLVFAMSKREARRLARTPVYVDAWSVTTR